MISGASLHGRSNGKNTTSVVTAQVFRHETRSFEDTASLQCLRRPIGMAQQATIQTKTLYVDNAWTNAAATAGLSFAPLALSTHRLCLIQS